MIHNVVRRFLLRLVVVIVLLTWLLPPLQAHRRDSVTAHGISFVRNERQWDDRVLFKASLHGGAIFAERNCLTFVLLHPQQLKEFYAAKFNPTHTINNGFIDASAYKMHFVGANQQVGVAGNQQIQGYDNYYIGKDSARWATRVPKFQEVVYRNLYPNIDLRLAQQQSHLKYEFLLAPGADPQQIRLYYEGVQNLFVSKGNLVISTDVMQVVELQPIAYQLDENGLQEIVPCRYVVKQRQLTFELGNYDPARPLVIDPVLIFSSYSGSTADNWGYTATYDKNGNLYSGGNVFDIGYPTTANSYQVDFAGGSTDIAISKFDAGGSFLHFTTYLGGTGTEVPHSLVVNDNNELYVFGTTSSADFPTTAGAFDTTFNGGVGYTLTSTVRFTAGSDIIIAKFNDMGTRLLGSTYVGGTANDGLNTVAILRKNYADEARGEIIIDEQSNVYVASCTQSPDFPVTTGVFDTAFCGGTQDACLIKMNHNLTNMIWCSFLGGTGDDAAYSLVLAPDNSLFVCGGTNSSALRTTPSAIQPTYGGGDNDGYVAHINPNGSQIQHLTYLGKNGYDQAYLIKNDKQGNPHIFGQTYAVGTAWVTNANWFIPNGGQFLTKLTPALDSVIWSTAFGTGAIGLDISPTALLVDLCNNIYMSGWGSPTTNNGQGGTAGLPITADAFQTTTDNNDYYFLCISDDASQLVYATYFGSPHAREHVDGGTSRFDNHGRIYQAVCAGCGSYDDFPTTQGAWSQTNNSTNCNIGVIKFDFNLPAVVADFNIPNTVCAPIQLEFHNNSQRISDSTRFFWDFGDGTTSTQETPLHTYTESGTYTITLIAADAGSCNFSDTISRELVVLSNANHTLQEVGICSGDFVQIGIPPAGSSLITYQWQPTTGLSNPHISNPIAAPNHSTTYSLFISDGVCIDTLTQNVEVEELMVDAGENIIVCAGETTTLIPTIQGNPIHYYWSNDPTFSSYLNTDFSSPTLTITPSSSTTYYLRVESAYCVAESQVSVEISQFQVTADNSYDVCYGDSVQISVTTSESGDYNYQWQPNSAVISGYGTATPWVRPLQNTTFTVIATNAYGCTATTNVPVSIHRYTTNAQITNATCYEAHNGSISLNVTDGVSPYFYQWSNGATNATLSNLPAGTYMVTITDNTGCNGVDSFLVAQPQPIAIVETDMTPVFCDQNCNGTLTVDASGGTQPYHFQWLHGSTTNVATQLCAGAYTVQVTDAHGCRAAEIFHVTDSSNYNLNYLVRQISCSEDCDGAIILYPDFAPFSYQVVWNQAEALNTNSLINLCPGEYQANIIVENGCTYHLYLQIDTTNSLHFVNLYATPPRCNGDSNAIIQFDVIGGLPPYQIFMNGELASSPLTNLVPGNYTISVVDANACQLDTTIQIIDTEPLIINGTHTSPPCREVCNGAISLQVAGGTIPYRYAWNSGQTNPFIENMCVGTYTVTVSDRNACTATKEIILTDSSLFPTDVAAWCSEDTIYAGEPTQLFSTDLGSAFRYQWQPQAYVVEPHSVTTTAYPLVTTDFIVVVRDEFGCEKTDTVRVYVREVICEEPYVFIPNAFSPNGDGKNDKLYVRGEVIVAVKLQLFDRWGEKVFETTDVAIGWDGNYRGKPCEPGIYDYYLSVTCLGQKQYVKKGNVTLLR